MKKIGICFYLICAGLTLTAQTTVGLLLNSEQSFNGYTLFAPNRSTITYLIDNCGFVVNEWLSDQVPELSVYLLEDGSLLRASHGKLYRYNWEGDLTWSYELNQLDIYNHHDIEPLPNGNILIIATEEFEVYEAISLGRNPNELDNGVEIDWIAEIEPIGNNEANLVWEWHAWDHLVQEFDANRQGYGIVSENPQLLDININYTGIEIFGMYDWLHCNGVDYNADLDQIVFSSRHTSEIYIIDHSTTTAEAADHLGGNAGKGGDLLWRWGNPENYNTGTAADRKLFGQHDPKWIPEGYPNAGKISVFNNGYQRPGDFSSIHLIEPTLQNDGNYSLENNAFLPNDFYWSWQGEVLNETFFGPIESGVNMLPNGNFLVCEVFDRFFEVTPNGDIVWAYKNPIAEGIIEQYDWDFSETFRAERYAPDYSAFIGKDLTPGNYIENENSVSDNCTIFELVNIENISNSNLVNIGPIPTTEFLNINTLWQNIQVKVYNAFGQKVHHSNKRYIDVTHLIKGIYFVEIENLETTKSQVRKFIIQ